MKTEDWIYIAPQRIRQKSLALPQCQIWPDFEALNMQRLARVFEFQSAIAFIGSGASACLKYPSWADLVPDSCRQILSGGKELKLTGKDIDTQQALQIIEQLVNDPSDKDGATVIFEHIKGRFTEKKELADKKQTIEDLEKQEGYTFGSLADLPVRRFVTTNYDKEKIGRAHV